MAGGPVEFRPGTQAGLGAEGIDPELTTVSAFRFVDPEAQGFCCQGWCGRASQQANATNPFDEGAGPLAGDCAGLGNKDEQGGAEQGRFALPEGE